ncbi:MAG: glycosyltransferase family 39 protein [Pseudomonadota bacterium]
MHKAEKVFVFYCLLIVICINLYCSSVGFSSALMDFYAFRQTQTAISAYYFLKEGFTLNYITPVFGAPWSIPFEFPTYQLIIASFSSLTTISLEAAGRLVSITFFYVTLIYLYKILLLFFDKTLSVIPIIFLLVCPQYIYWSRTVMIESTALFLCVSHFYYFLKLNKAISAWDLFFCILFGILGSLTKITTYIVVMTPAGIYFIGKLIFDIRARNVNIKFWISLISPVVISFAAAICWTKYCDHLKDLNPLAQGFLTSSSLIEWNFGTLQQRLSFANWQKIATWTIQYGVGSPFILLLLPLFWGLVSKKNRLFVGLALCGFLSGPLIFFNLYYVHSYYHYSNIFFIIIALGVVIIAVAGDHKLSPIVTRSAVWCVMPLVTIIMLYGYISSNYFGAQNCKFRISSQIACLRDNLQETDMFLIYDNDWSSELLYFLERKGIMNYRSFPLNHPQMVRSLELTGKESITAIMKKDFNLEFAEEVQRTFGIRFLPVFPGIYVREDRYPEISAACPNTSDSQ